MTNPDALLLALAMVAAIVLDDVVAVQENIVRHAELGADRGRAARMGPAEIRGPLRAATLAFLPLLVFLGFAGRSAGRGFVPVALGVAGAAVVSLLSTPALLPKVAGRRLPGRRSGALGRWGDLFTDRYHEVLAWSLDHRRPAVLVTLILLALSAAIPGAISRIDPWSAAPPTTTTSVSVELVGPDGQTLLGVAHRVADAVRQVPGVVALDITPAESIVRDPDGDHVAQVRAGVVGRSPLAVAGELGVRLDTVPLPPDHSAHLRGPAVEYLDALGRFPLVIALAALLVYAALALRFRSWVEPLTLVLVLPLVATVTLAGGLLLGWDVTIPGLLGVTLMMGIALRHATLLVSCARRRRSRHGNLRVALIGAGRVRLRPILITTAGLAAGLVPLVLSGHDAVRDFARFAMLGAIAAPAITLLLLPAFHDGVVSWWELRRISTWRSMR
jgi:multidrug efflux pump subunit AcrB